MHVLIVGGGIGGLAAALSLHATGIQSTVFEQVREPRELGVGINTLPHAIKELAALGLLPALDRAGIRTRELIYANRFGQVVWREPRGIDAGLDTPQFSIHRGKLHTVLLDAVRERLGHDAIKTSCRLVSFAERGDRVEARFEQRDGGETIVADGDALVGADGIHSATRAVFYPNEGAPVWNGTMLWRGAANWPVHVDGRTMVIAGGMSAKFVFYPIHFDPASPARRLTNWAVERGIELEDLQVVRPTLEDIYLELTGGPPDGSPGGTTTEIPEPRSRRHGLHNRGRSRGEG